MTYDADCMLRKCEKYPGSTAVREFLETLLDDNDKELDDVMNIAQWTQTDRSNITNYSESYAEYLDRLENQLADLTPHHYYKEHQSRYLSTLKENLCLHSAIIQLDFAENYAFIVQDANQVYHWNNAQATVHPAAVYYKNDSGQLCHL